MKQISRICLDLASVDTLRNTSGHQVHYVNNVLYLHITYIHVHVDVKQTILYVKLTICVALSTLSSSTVFSPTTNTASHFQPQTFGIKKNIKTSSLIFWVTCLSFICPHQLPLTKQVLRHHPTTAQSIYSYILTKNGFLTEKNYSSNT